jgi:hypothetical protein
MAFALGGLFWIAVPFLDPSAADRKRSRIIGAIGVIIVSYIVAMTVYGYLA